MKNLLSIFLFIILNQVSDYIPCSTIESQNDETTESEEQRSRNEHNRKQAITIYGKERQAMDFLIFTGFSVYGDR